MSQFKAVKMILTHPNLNLRIIIDEKSESVSWNKIDYSALPKGSQTMVSWARALWADSAEKLPRNWVCPFAGLSCLDSELQSLVLHAGAIRETP